MIARYWRGVVRPEQADAYFVHLQAQTFPQLSKIPGFIAGSILRRELSQGTEFVVVTQWESLDAIERFAGRDIEAVVVPEQVQRLMLEYDRRVRHYEVMK